MTKKDERTTFVFPDGEQRRLVISEDGVLFAVYHDVVRRDLVVYKQRCSVLSEV